MVSRFPKHHYSQIAIAIGVLTSNRGEGDEPLWRIGRGIAECSGRGAIAGCHRRVPLSCAMVGGGEGDDQLWGSGCGALQGAIAGCAMVGT